MGFLLFLLKDLPRFRARGGGGEFTRCFFILQCFLFSLSLWKSCPSQSPSCSPVIWLNGLHSLDRRMDEVLADVTSRANQAHRGQCGWIQKHFSPGWASFEMSSTTWNRNSIGVFQTPLKILQRWFKMLIRKVWLLFSTFLVLSAPCCAHNGYERMKQDFYNNVVELSVCVMTRQWTCRYKGKCP